MAIYDFIGGKATLVNVKRIIEQAGFEPTNYAYAERLDHDGQTVTGTPVMSTTLLRGAARKLKLSIEISSPSALYAEADADLQGSPYSLSFTMDQATLDRLQGSSLVVFKGVQAPGVQAGSAVPLAWIVSTAFGLKTKIAWQEDYSAYTSTEEIIPNGVISAYNPVPIDIGETYNVDKSGGGNVVSNGQSNAISIHNLSNRQFTCGIAQTPAGGGDAKAICAFDLYGGDIDVIIPEEKIFMMFVRGTVDTGTVYEKSVSRGLFIDMTGVAGRTGISYDINGGWNWGDYNWAKQYPASSDMVPLLIDSSVSLQSRQPSRLTLAA